MKTNQEKATAEYSKFMQALVETHQLNYIETLGLMEALRMNFIKNYVSDGTVFFVKVAPKDHEDGEE